MSRAVPAPMDDFANRLRAGDPLVGAWSMVGDPVAVEVLAGTDVDFVVVDGEHSENTVGDLADLVRAVDATDDDVATVARVSGPDRAEIRRVLDFGPDAVLVPQIESAEMAREAVAAASYPPEGVRGVAGGRASDYGTRLSGYVAEANRTVATVLQVETTGAVDDLEEIVDIDGLDALFVGPADLSARLGAFGDFESERFRATIERIVAVAEPAGVPVGTLATGLETVGPRWTDWEMDFLVAGTDVGYLREGAGRYLDALAAARED